MPGFLPGTDPLLDSYDESREYSLRDLAAVTNVSRHAIGHYFKRGILPKTESRGPYTKYAEQHRIRLLAIARLREQGFGLAQMARALDGASLDDIFRLAGYEPPRDEPEVAPAPPPVRGRCAGAARARAAAARACPRRLPLALGAHAAHLGERGALPGVFLVVLGDADTEARRVAREIEATYGAVK